MNGASRELYVQLFNFIKVQICQMPHCHEEYNIKKVTCKSLHAENIFNTINRLTRLENRH